MRFQGIDPAAIFFRGSPHTFSTCWRKGSDCRAFSLIWRLWGFVDVKLSRFCGRAAPGAKRCNLNHLELPVDHRGDHIPLMQQRGRLCYLLPVDADMPGLNNSAGKAAGFAEPRKKKPLVNPSSGAAFHGFTIPGLSERCPQPQRASPLTGLVFNTVFKGLQFGKGAIRVNRLINWLTVMFTAIARLHAPFMA